MLETDARSAEQCIELLDEVRREQPGIGGVLVVITNHGYGFNTPNLDEYVEASHLFEDYLFEYGIKQTL